MGDASTSTLPRVRNGLWLSAWCVVAAFGTYFCMYGFRKPFTAGRFDATFGGVDLKTILVTAQVLGYTLSKFVGIKVIAEVQPHRRVALIVALVAGAQAALLLFAVTPAPFNAVWLFVNGLLLGMVFGLVLGFLEGRRHTEALAAGLCASFIVADGVTKSVGAYLLQAGVSEAWMPFAAGLVFTPPLAVGVAMLTRIPRPSPEDIALRSERTPLDRAGRGALFRRYATGLTLLILVYLLITVLRSVRADFAPEIWSGLMETTVPPAVYSWSEMAVAAGVLLLAGATVLIRSHRRAFFAGLGLALGGPILIAAALVGDQAGVLSPLPFMVLIGLGLYLPYILVHTTLFERLMAMTRERGNIGYLMYLADAFGYLGYVAVLLGRTVAAPGDDFLSFFIVLSWATAVACVLLLVPCWRYFARRPVVVEHVTNALTKAGDS
jgi:Family of unknown function (DUF5690)